MTDGPNGIERNGPQSPQLWESQSLMEVIFREPYAERILALASCPVLLFSQLQKMGEFVSLR